MLKLLNCSSPTPTTCLTNPKYTREKPSELSFRPKCQCRMTVSLSLKKSLDGRIPGTQGKRSPEWHARTIIIVQSGWIDGIEWRKMKGFSVSWEQYRGPGVHFKYSKYRHRKQESRFPSTNALNNTCTRRFDRRFEWGISTNRHVLLPFDDRFDWQIIKSLEKCTLFGSTRLTPGWGKESSLKVLRTDWWI